eukprot:gene18849-25401_t
MEYQAQMIRLGKRGTGNPDLTGFRTPRSSHVPAIDSFHWILRSTLPNPEIAYRLISQRLEPIYLSHRLEPIFMSQRLDPIYLLVPSLENIALLIPSLGRIGWNVDTTSA